MRRSGRSPNGTDEDEPSLFDLPLDFDSPGEAGEDGELDLAADFAPPPPPKPHAARPAPVDVAPPVPPASRSRDLDRSPALERPGDRPGSRPRPAAVPTPAAEPVADRDEVRAGVGARLLAGLADLVAHLAVTAVALAGAHSMGATLTLHLWPAFLLFVLPLSFLYTILPLAFWGQTLGMTWAGISSRNRDGEPLTFDQAARRWVGILVTIALVGLPLLIALGGRGLTDLLSGSETYRGA